MSDRDRDIEHAAQIAAIKAVLDRMEAELTRHGVIFESVGRIEGDLSSLKEDFSKIRKTLHYGNGKPPLTQQLATLEAKVDVMNSANSRRAREVGAIAVAVVSSLGAIAVAFIAK